MAGTVGSLPRVLVVEPAPELLQEQRDQLGREGFIAEGESDPAKALERIKLEPFDLLLTARDFPGPMSGVQLCRDLKSQPQLAWIPVMFVAGDVSAGSVEQLFEAGADEFVSRPCPPGELAVRAKVLVRKGHEERWLVERARKLAEKIAERDDELDDLRRFAQDIVSALPSALLVLDAAGTILFANAPFLSLLGAGRGEVVGRKLSDFFSSDSLTTGLNRAIDGAVNNGQPSWLRRIAHFMKARDGMIADLTIAPIEYAGVRQVLLVIEDVTDRARAETTLELERSKLNNVVNAMNAALCLIGRDRKIVWTNRTFDLWFGDSFGQPGFSAFLSNMSRNESWVEPVFTKGQIQHVAWSVYTSQGQRRFFANIVAPIRTEAGRPAEQALILTQDVTEQETRVEQLSLLRELSQYLQQTLDVGRLNHVILLCVTAGYALGFNRAFLFKRNRQKNILEAEAAVGPTSREEAFRIWADLSSQARTLSDLVREIESKGPGAPASPLFNQIQHVQYNLDDPSEIIVRTALEKKSQVVTGADRDPRISEHFRRTFGAQEFVSVPLIVKNTVVGVLLTDNLYSGRPITDDHVKLMTLFAAQAALAIENADTYAELQMRMAELHHAQDQIVHSEKLAAVGKMAAYVAHEIRNPLATIGGFARAVLKRPDNVERVAKNAKIIAEESTRLENLLKGVMDFSRPNAPVLKSADLNALVERIFRNHTERLAHLHIHGDLDLDRSLPEVVFDQNQIQQVLDNLVRNAADSMRNGGALRMKTAREGDWVLVAVTDTGSGIPEDVRDRIFSPFMTTKPDGTGLGLAVVKKILDDHGGKIDFTSQVGSGTTFSMHLPIHRAPPPIAAAVAQVQKA